MSRRASEPATLAAVSAVSAVGGHRERSVGARRRGHPPCSGEGWRRGTSGAVAGDGRVGGPAGRRPGAGRGDPRYGRECRGDPDRGGGAAGNVTPAGSQADGPRPA
ncbi:MAG: hypothetical protein E6G35_05395 [Actinobacteria bacterium]|nr:MAG: hypothetical protein E6G35_05395 [Actinomycetota bacterium]